MAAVRGGQDLTLTNECDKHPNFIYDAPMCIWPSDSGDEHAVMVKHLGMVA